MWYELEGDKIGYQLLGQQLGNHRHDYCARIRRSFADLPAGITVHLAFRLTERIASSSLASERGKARMSGSGPRGPLPVRYNRFHTVARRTDGRWRLVVDYDGGTTDAGTFHTAHEVTPRPDQLRMTWPIEQS